MKKLLLGLLLVLTCFSCKEISDLTSDKEMVKKLEKVPEKTFDPKLVDIEIIREVPHVSFIVKNNSECTIELIYVIAEATHGWGTSNVLIDYFSTKKPLESKGEYRTGSDACVGNNGLVIYSLKYSYKGAEHTIAKESLQIK